MSFQTLAQVRCRLQSPTPVLTVDVWISQMKSQKQYLTFWLSWNYPTFESILVKSFNLLGQTISETDLLVVLTSLSSNLRDVDGSSKVRSTGMDGMWKGINMKFFVGDFNQPGWFWSNSKGCRALSKIYSMTPLNMLDFFFVLQALLHQASFYHPLTFNEQGYMTSADVEVTQLTVAWWIKTLTPFSTPKLGRISWRKCDFCQPGNFSSFGTARLLAGSPVLRGSQLHKCTEAVASLEKWSWEGRSMNFLQMTPGCLWQSLRQNPPPSPGDGDGQGVGPPPDPDPPVLVEPITAEQLSAFTMLQPTLRGVSQRNGVVRWVVSFFETGGEFWSISMLNNALQPANFCQYRNGWKQGHCEIHAKTLSDCQLWKVHMMEKGVQALEHND